MPQEQTLPPSETALENHRRWTTLDKAHCWHPFTPLGEWCSEEHDPVVIISGEGCWLTDSLGRSYLDGNSSIWTNIHGHRHPVITSAVVEQLSRIAHSSYLGLANPLASELAAELCGHWPHGTLTRCFFSDDGSTAAEAALKLAAQYWQITGAPHRTRFLAFDHAYHGDTMGASSLGGIPLFHGRFDRWHFPVEHIGSIDALAERDPCDIAAVWIEPLIQGAAGMRCWPRGTLADLRSWCDRTGVLLVADEVMTGFGRTGTLYACQQERVIPDLLLLAKGLTGGYSPLGATLVSNCIGTAFLNANRQNGTFFHGHSYTGHALGCAAALANLRVFAQEKTLERINRTTVPLFQAAIRETFDGNPWVKDIRTCGMIAGVEFHDRDGKSFPPEDRVGHRICMAARKHGLMTRPIRDTVTLMPPLTVTADEIRLACRAIAASAAEMGLT